MHKILLSILCLVITSCGSFPTQDTLHKMDVSKDALIVGKFEVDPLNTQFFEFNKLSFYLLDNRSGLGKDLHNTSTQPVDDDGYFSFALPKGDWELDQLLYSSTYIEDRTQYIVTFKIPLDHFITVQENAIYNVGTIKLTVIENDDGTENKQVEVLSNSDDIQKYVTSLPISDALKQQAIHNTYEEN